MATITSVATATSTLQHRLPLVGIENAFVVDDRAAFPMTSYLDFGFSGTLDRQRFQDSVVQASKRHPLFCSLLDGDVPYAVWRYAEVQPEVCFDTIADSSQQIDIRSSSGLKICVSSRGETHRLGFLWHHAVSDGGGVFSLLRDILAFYGGEESKLPQLVPEFLEERGEFPKNWDPEQRRLRRKYDFAYTLALLRNPPVSLAASSQESIRISYEQLLISQKTLTGLKRVSAELDMQQSDLLIAELFWVLHQWNLQHGVNQREKAIRLILPVNLRHSKADREMPAANRIGYSVVSSTGGQLRLSATFREGMKRRMQLRLADRPHLKLAFLDWLSRWMPALVSYQQVFSNKRRHGTAVFTINGDPTARWPLPRDKRLISVDGLTLESIGGAAPLRPHTLGAFAISSYGRSACLSAQTALAAGDTKALLQRYKLRLEQIAGVSDEN